MTPKSSVHTPAAVERYQSWLYSLGQRKNNKIQGYLFDEPEVRFEVRPEDLIVSTPGCRLVANGHTLAMAVPGTDSLLPLEATTALQLRAPQLAQTMLSRLDGSATLSELQTSSASRALLQAFIEDGLGKWLFVPLAVANCEKAISGAEIARFPGSPYEIQRNYWENMGAVRRELTALPDSIQHDAAFKALLRHLHAIALIGADARTFYRPASRIGRQKLVPGQFHSGDSQLQETSHGTLVLQGIRVGVPAVGGQYYHTLLYQSVRDGTAENPRQHVDAHGLLWGRCILGRSANENAARPWFCPPRPMRAKHFRQLRLSLQGAHRLDQNDDLKLRIKHLARFHQQFVQLHPFACANQSVAMNIVNDCLTSLVGAGLPHLILDQLALRLSPSAYQVVFERAVETYIAPGLSSAERHRQLAQARTAAFALSARLEQCHSLQQAAELAASTPDSKLLLLP